LIDLIIPFFVFNLRKAEKGLAKVQKNIAEAKNMQFDSRVISYGINNLN
jgi:hypothetical protein